MSTLIPSNLRQRGNFARRSGFSLIEVLVAVVVLSVGLLALAALQASLIRNSADAKARTSAMALAEAQLERLRSVANAGEYLGMTDSPSAETHSMGGTDFTRAWAVNRWWFNSDPDSNPATADGRFETVSDTGALDGGPEFKQIQVTVSWTTESGEVRNVRSTDMISSAVPTDSTGVVRPRPTARRTPEVHIFRPSEAGIIPIALGNDRAAASSNPRPEIFDEGATATTRFNVQTYVGENSNTPLLQRRLEFAFASCECEMTATSSASNPAYRPSFWDGDRYTIPEAVEGQRIGTQTRRAQDEFLCTVCCRDHHDSSSSTPKYDPFRVGDVAGGDHNHYTNTDINDITQPEDNLVLATGGDEYFDACRMVRVDGIMRAATDTQLLNFTSLNMERGLTGPQLPAAIIPRYSAFVIAFVQSFWNNLPGTYPQTQPVPNPLLTDSGLLSSFEDILDFANDDAPVGLNVDATHNLHGRGLYVDYISDATRAAIACIGNTSDAACRRFANRTVLELLPFVAVNLTNLADWTENTNETIMVMSPNLFPLRNRPTERGVATGESVGAAEASGHSFASNSGLTDQTPVDPDDAARDDTYNRTGDVEQFLVASTVSTDKPINVNLTYPDAFGPRRLRVSVADPPAAECGDRDPSTRNCIVTETATTLTLVFEGYNYPQGQQLNDFALCPPTLPAGVTAGGITVNGSGLETESSTIVLTSVDPIWTYFPNGVNLEIAFSQTSPSTVPCPGAPPSPPTALPITLEAPTAPQDVDFRLGNVVVEITSPSSSACAGAGNARGCAVPAATTVLTLRFSAYNYTRSGGPPPRPSYNFELCLPSLPVDVMADAPVVNNADSNAETTDLTIRAQVGDLNTLLTSLTVHFREQSPTATSCPPVVVGP